MANWRNGPVTEAQKRHFEKLDLRFGKWMTAGEASDLLIQFGVPNHCQRQPVSVTQLHFLMRFSLGEAGDAYEADRLIAEYEKTIPVTPATARKLEQIGYSAAGMTEAEAAFAYRYRPPVMLLKQLRESGCSFGDDISRFEAEALLDRGSSERSAGSPADDALFLRPARKKDSNSNPKS